MIEILLSAISPKIHLHTHTLIHAGMVLKLCFVHFSIEVYAFDILCQIFHGVK